MVNSITKRLAFFHCLGGGVRRQHSTEFLPTCARDKKTMGSGNVMHRLRYSLQTYIAFGVSVMVVKQFEMINVYHHYRQGLTCVQGYINDLSQALIE